MRKLGKTYTTAPKAVSIINDVLDGTGPICSLREAYVEITGDRALTGRVDRCDRVRMAEAFAGTNARFAEAIDTSAFANVLGAAINRRMVDEYRRDGIYNVWRRIASVARSDDFKTRHAVRYGGYGDLPGVGEGDPYPALTSPQDEVSSYAVSKRGGTEEITLEAFRNDDVQAFRRLPKRLADSAHRTLSKFTLGFLESNPTIYDGIPLFHASHGNVGNASLSAVSVEAGRTAMRKQREPGSGDPLWIPPRSLLVPLDLEEPAFNIFRRGTNQDKTFLQSNALDVVPVWYWGDIDDWCLVADPALCPTIEVSFLDGNEEPELLLQDVPTVGSLFSHDKLAYKIRHVYGGSVIDYRGLYKAIVA